MGKTGVMKKSVLYLQYTNPSAYPPLEHSGLILLKAGWDVHFFGIQSEGESNKLTFPEALAGRVSLWKNQSPGLKQKLHYIAFTLAALRRALWERSAWVYCSDLMSCPAAWLIGHLTRCRVLYHEHDSPNETKGENRKQETEMRKVDRGNPEAKHHSGFPLSYFQRFLLWTRQYVGQMADLVILPNQKRLELFVQATGRKKPSLCVYNCPRMDEIIPQRREPSMLGILRMVFHGSINPDRLPLSVLEAMSRFPERTQLTIIGYETIGSKGYMATFLREAKRFGLDKKVVFLGALSHHDIFKRAFEWDLGLAFMPLQGGDVNMAYMTGASNKPFDYLACGLTLLVSIRPEWEEMYVQPGYGLPCNPNDADSIATQLRWFLEHPVETHAMGERGRQRILTGWNYENQFAPVVEKLI